MLRDDVLIWKQLICNITMQNNGAMKIVNFTHVQMAETRRSFSPSVNAGVRGNSAPREVSPRTIFTNEYCPPGQMRGKLSPFSE